MKASKFAVCLLVLIGVANVAAQGQSRQVVVDQLEHASHFFEVGFDVVAGDVDDMVIGLLPDEGEAYLEVWLEEGFDYIISGVCDEDCIDLDLYLRDPEGMIIDDDFETDSIPMVATTASSTGRYLLGIDMVDCEADWCYFGYRVYKRPSALTDF